MQRITLILLGGAALLGCETAPPMTAAQNEARLQQHLAGWTPGQALNCLPARSSASVEAIGNNILYRDGGRIWLSRVQSGTCAQLEGPGATLVTKTTGPLCSGEVVHVLASGGMPISSCMLGPFVPYRAP